jgi:hypothetical protein
MEIPFAQRLKHSICSRVNRGVNSATFSDEVALDKALSA